MNEFDAMLEEVAKESKEENSAELVKIEIVEKVKCDSLEGRFLFVRVGDDKNPSTDEQVESITEKLEAMFKDNGVNCLTFVTHHAVDIQII